jgi:hypothetical protein
MNAPANALLETEAIRFLNDLTLGTGTGMPHYAWIHNLMSGTAKATREGLEGSATDFRPFDVLGYASPLTRLRRLSSTLTADPLVRVFLKVIDLALPSEDARKLKVYQALMNSLRQRIAELEELIPKNELECQDFINYERHEPPHITSAFLRAMNTTSPSNEERLPTYTEEELNRF